jgi:hypothetical protein
MKRLFYIFSGSFILLSIAIVIYSCKHEIIYPSNYGYPGTPYGTYTPPPQPPQGKQCNPDSVYFNNDILPILISNCTMCHSSSGGEETFNLSSYTAVMYSGTVSPGNPSRSRMYRSITGSGEDRMPPSSKPPLSQAQIDLIYKWIQQGAKNLTCDACDTGKYTFSGAVFPVIQNNCLGCHSGSNPGGGVSLASYNNILVVVNNGKLMCDLNQTTNSSCPNWNAMPKGGYKLSDCILNQFNKWIKNGAKNN